MITIGICDDRAGQNELLARYLGRHRESASFRVFSATSPEDFLAMLPENGPDIAFLDIDMGGMNGIRLGERIREAHPGAILIYVTAHEEFALEAFRVRAFHYLLKPVSAEALHKALDEALRALGGRGEAGARKTFAVRRKGEVVRLDYDGILYFEKVGHKIRVEALEGAVEYYGNFSMLLGQIEDGAFLRCHQGYIVNMGKVRACRDGMLSLEGGRRVPVSRSRAEAVREALAKMLFAGKAEP